MERKRFESYIKRMTPEIPITIDLGTEQMTARLKYDNTLVVTHDEEYKHFDYVLLYDESVLGEPVYMFRDADEFGLGDLLIEQGFDNYTKRYPSLEDEKRWFEYQTEDLEDPPF